MKQHMTLLFYIAASMAASAMVLAADDASIGRDLQATIVLQGHPCDRIVASKRNADSDYVATCKDGNRYHVFVSPQGRVVVEKL